MAKTKAKEVKQKSKAGAPRKDEAVRKVPISVKLPPYLIHFMDKQGDRQRPTVIEEAVLAHYGVTPDELIDQFKKDAGEG